MIRFRFALYAIARQGAKGRLRSFLYVGCVLIVETAKRGLRGAVTFVVAFLVHHTLLLSCHDAVCALTVARIGKGLQGSKQIRAMLGNRLQ